LITLSFTFLASAQESATNYFADGVEALEVADYEDAIKSFKKSIDLDPSNLEFHYYLGLTYSAAKRYEDALGIFESITDKEPAMFRKVYFEMASVYARQEKYQKAIDTLNLVEKIDPKDTRIYIEKGYACQRLKDYDKAIENFNKAKDLDPKLTQVACYNIAAVYYEVEEFDRSEEMFYKAIEVDPSTVTAEHARKSIINLKGARKARKPWYASVSFNYGYDDNVLQKPLEQATIVSATGETLDEADQFQTFLLTGGVKFINRKDLEIGAGYSLYCAGYKELTDSNVLGHIPHLYLQYSDHPFYFRIQYDFSYYYAGGKENGQDNGFFLTFGNDSDGQLRMHSIMPTFTIIEPHNLKSEITLSYQNKEYLDETTSDASHYSAAIVQSYKIPNTQCFPRIGYKYGYEDANVEESIYRYHQGLLGLSSHIYWGIQGDFSLTYERTDYHYNPLYAEQGERGDRKYIGAISLSRSVSDMFSLTFSYNYTHNNSNVTRDGQDSYKFKKNLYSLMITRAL
jgi:tetratricopeptide (TPR) repeat protein